MSQDNSTKLDRDLAGYYGYTIPINDFFRCALSVDCVIFGYSKKKIKVLLIKRGVAPFEGEWALPGDLMYPYEDLNKAAHRVLKSLTGISSVYMDQIKTFGEVDRHPIGRVITISYYAMVNMDEFKPEASSWAEKLQWHSLEKIPDLAFDHNKILESAMSGLRRDTKTSLIVSNLLPDKFTLNDIQDVHESIMNEEFDKANFRKKILSLNLLEPLEEMRTNVSHRPAQLYRLKKRKANSKISQI